MVIVALESTLAAQLGLPEKASKTDQPNDF